MERSDPCVPAEVPFAPATSGYAYALEQDADHPDLATVVVTDAAGTWLATFTDGAYTVAVAGPERRFCETVPPHAGHPPVASTTWVRVHRPGGSPTPFAVDDDSVTKGVDEAWLGQALAANAAGKIDVLGIAMQYVAGSPGDAGYGPALGDAGTEKGADFNDYLGVDWNYGGETDPWEEDEWHMVDCSGYVRLVWGFRAGLPLALEPTGDGSAIPRTSQEMHDDAPGVLTVTPADVAAETFGHLAPGDLVFFDDPPGGATEIRHVGMYLGVDDDGHRRFISSRISSDGPTLGNHVGPSTLDEDGFHFPDRFVAARRL